jgi:hypothetical protein
MTTAEGGWFEAGDEQGTEMKNPGRTNCLTTIKEEMMS